MIFSSTALLLLESTVNLSTIHNGFLYTTGTTGYPILKIEKDGTEYTLYLTDVTGLSAGQSIADIRLGVSYGERAHSEGMETLAYGTDSHAEGKQTGALGAQAHSEGIYTTAIGD